MSTDIGSRFISAIPTSLIIGLKVKVMDLELFYVKVLNSSYFPDHVMDLVYTLYDDRYKSKMSFSNTTPTQIAQGTCSGKLCYLMTVLVFKTIKKIIAHYKRIGYNIDVMQQTACLVFVATD